MNKNIFCTKLQEEAESLATPPYPGELGKLIQKNISKKAWKMWLDQQTILINEYRLNTLDPNARKFLVTEMKKYLLLEN